MSTDPTRYRITATTPDGGDIDLDVEEIHDPQTGQRFTEADARQFSEARRGRPSLTGRHRTTPALSVRIEPETRELVSLLAARNNITVAEVTRRALREYVASHAAEAR